MREERNSLDLYMLEVKSNRDKLKNEDLCFKNARLNKEIFNKIVQKNLGLVVKISKKYASNGLPLEDIIQEGNIGLMEAISRFDETRGWKFSTYAIWWIRYHIYLAIYYKKRIIRFPSNKEKDIFLLEKTKNNLKDLLGREPTREEVINELHLKEEYISLLEKMSSYNHVAYDLLDNTINMSSGYTTEADKATEKYFLQDNLSIILNKIDQKKANIIKSIYGICGEHKLRINDVARKFNFTPARIRQIKKDFLITAKRRYKYLQNFI